MKKTIIIVVVIIVCLININSLLKKERQINNNALNIKVENKVSVQNSSITTLEDKPKTISDWRLILVNYENALPENYEMELEYIDDTRQFDSRAIGELNQMLLDMKKCGISNVWVQSSYRSVEYQQNLFNNKIAHYMKQGKNKKEAEILTLQTINKPGTSEHNLGLAVDFNYVDYSFEDLKGFEWLTENAENYGFVLRYRKDKEDITKVDYEPWHWRYVGKENAKKMNELDMCLEEYVEYLLR